MWFDMAGFLGFPERPAEVKKDSLIVDCFPNPEDPQVTQKQHRVVCLTKPYATCLSCPHSHFVLSFKEDKEERLTQVACPRWASESRRLAGEDPEYVATEEATCEKKPFLFCASCPSRKELVETYSADKTRPGWYGRYRRLRKEDVDER